MLKILLPLLIFLLVTSNSYSLSIISTFDLDDEAWSADGALMTHEAAGGNPGGFLRIEDDRGDTYSVFAPAKFQGDLSAFDRGVFSYEVILLHPTVPLGSVGSGFGRIQLLGGGSNATFDYAPDPPVPSSEFWKFYTVPLTASAWNTTQDNWEKILADVTKIDIILEPIGGEDIIGFDNFKIEPVPEPATFFLVGFSVIGLLIRKRSSE